MSRSERRRDSKDREKKEEQTVATKENERSSERGVKSSRLDLYESRATKRLARR